MDGDAERAWHEHVERCAANAFTLANLYVLTQ